MRLDPRDDDLLIERLKAEIAALTARLEAAERIIREFVDPNIAGHCGDKDCDECASQARIRQWLSDADPAPKEVRITQDEASRLVTNIEAAYSEGQGKEVRDVLRRFEAMWPGIVPSHLPLADGGQHG